MTKHEIMPDNIKKHKSRLSCQRPNRTQKENPQRAAQLRERKIEASNISHSYLKVQLIPSVYSTCKADQ